MTDYIVELDKIGFKTGYRYLLNDISWNIKGENTG